MNVRFDYILKETMRNFLRNVSLTIPTVLTVAISLALIGLSLVVTFSIDNLSETYKEEIEFIIWLKNPVEDLEACDSPDQAVKDACVAQQSQYEDTKTLIKQGLEDSAAVKDFEFINQQETFIEFQKYYADSPEILEIVQPEVMPESFRVVPASTDKSVIEDFRERFRDRPGVNNIGAADDLIKDTVRFSNMSRWIMLATASLAFVASAMLMYNSIRTAVYARRREIEVMSLVGATKWFIRVPFMLEALLQGLLGAIVGVIFVAIVKFTFLPQVEKIGSKTIGFNISIFELSMISFALLILGSFLGAIAAGIAVSKYLDT